MQNAATGEISAAIIVIRIVLSPILILVSGK
jgi:hypothetical protein